MADIANSHPELVKRYNKLVEESWKRSWFIGITSSSRSYDEQAALYRAYLNHTGNNAANPDQVLGKSPWGWPVKGSYHMEQADGFTHALDLHWSQCSPEQFAELANYCGLHLTVPGENWHFQWWDTDGIFDNPSAQPEPTDEEEDDMTPLIHTPTPRAGIANVYDFTYLPADTGGQAAFGIVVSSNLYIRRNGGAPVGFTVYIQGAPTKYNVPEDGTTVTVPVTHEGLISVVGDVIVEAREMWRKG